MHNQMKMINALRLICCLLLMTSCGQEGIQEVGDENPAAPGFNFAESDPAAIELADSVMAAMGGRENWDQVRYISWNFFGRRNLTWDKADGNVRIESIPDSTIYLFNIHTMEGRVQIGGEEITGPDSLRKLIQQGKSIWINDSYWLLMPFKLKDSGVTLKYLGEDTTMNGLRSNVLELTFDNVGDTPENKYRVFVDVNDNLVKQWAYYKDAAQDSASQVWPWDNYKRYGKILLSADRSDGKGPRNVRIDEKLPDGWFTEFDVSRAR